MIAFAAVVADPERYAEYAKRSLELFAEPESLIVSIDDQVSIFDNYNQVLDAVSAIDGVEALVLMHEDVAVRNTDICDRIRILLAEHPETAVLGAIGAREILGIDWWEGAAYGHVREPRGPLGDRRGYHEVEAVDGMWMVLSPWAIKNLRYDLNVYPACFHGYDVELCFLARAQGKQVAVADFELFHATKGSFGNRDTWRQVNRRFVRRWLTDPANELPAEWLVPSGFDCRVCGSELPKAAAVAWRSVISCPGCGLGHTVPPPTRDITGDHVWQGLYAGQRNVRREQWLLEGRIRLAWIRRYVPAPATLLDVGAATGEQVEESTRAGYSAVGVEPSRSAVEDARAAGVEIFAGTLDEWADEHPGERFQVVTLFHVLEHVDEPVSLLTSIGAVLEPGGLLFLEVPNFNSAFARLDPFHWIGAERGQLDEHAAHYSPQTLRILFEKVGFEAVEISEIDYSAYASGTDLERMQEAYLEKQGFEELPQDLLRAVARWRG